MAAQVITAPFATPERVAEILGVPKSRVDRLLRWARETSPDGASIKFKRGQTNAKSSPRKITKKNG